MSKRGHRPCLCCIHPQAKQLSEDLLNHLCQKLQESTENFKEILAGFNRNGAPVVKSRPPTETPMTRRQRAAMKGRTIYKPKLTLASLARKYHVSEAGLVRHRVHLLRAMKIELRELNLG